MSERAAGALAGIVVNYNAREHLLSCVESLLGDGVGVVVVVDNGSTDGSEGVLLQRFPQVAWIPAGTNLGYGTAVDVGAACPAAQGADLLVCNPDVVVRPGAVAALRERLGADARVGLVGPRIHNTDGSVYPSARSFPSLLDALGHGFAGQFWPGNPWSRRYTMADWDHNEPRDVDWVSGSCFLARREAWDAVGGFDRAYFMYMEDVDLCWRVRGAGWSVAYEPSSEVLHVQGASADRHPYRMLLAHHSSMWRFALRTTRGWRRLALPVVLAGLLARLCVTMARRAVVGGARPGRTVAP